MWPPSHVFYKDAIPKFIERVETASGGRIKIELHPGGALVPTSGVLDALGAGVIDIADHAMFYEMGKIPLGNFAHWLPFSTKTPEQWWSLVYRYGIIDLYRQAYKPYGVYYLGPNLMGAYGNVISKKPVRTLNDFKGMTIRAGGPVAKIYEALGASTTMVPLAEVYTSLATGVFDAVVPGPGVKTYTDFKLHEIAKYFVLPPFTPTSTTEIDVSMRTWEKLPDDLKEIITTAQRATSWDYFEIQKNGDKEAVKVMKTAGVEFIQLPNTDVAKLEEIARSQWDDLAKDDLSKKAVDIIKAYIGK
jgi:TRAP-type mannitol/chloroaromatic compound transport system substrate-binding protein